MAMHVAPRLRRKVGYGCEFDAVASWNRELAYCFPCAAKKNHEAERNGNSEPASSEQKKCLLSIESLLVAFCRFFCDKFFDYCGARSGV
jgi:hypothetical protein